MGTLKVCDEGLNIMSVQCTAIASRLAGQVPTPAAGPPAQATAAAVGSAYAVLNETAAVLAARVLAAGRKLTTSASRYEGTEETSAQQLAELSGGLGRQ